MADEIYTLLTVKVKSESSGKRQELFDWLKNNKYGVEFTKSFGGCISIEGRMATDDDVTIVVWQKWCSQAHFEAYKKERRETNTGFRQWKDDIESFHTMFLSKESF